MRRILLLVLIVVSCSAAFGIDKAQEFSKLLQADIDAGRYSKALATIHAILEKYPQLVDLRIKSAEVKYLMGRKVDAEKELRGILDMDIPADLREEIRGYIEAINVGQKIDIEVSVAYTYDDNVTRGDYDPISFYGLNFTRNNSSLPQGDSGIESSLGVNHFAPINDGLSWVSSFDVDSTNYFRWSQYDLAILRLSTGPSIKKGKAIWFLPVVADHVILGSDRYSTGAGVRPGLFLPLSKRLAISTSVVAKKTENYYQEPRSGYLGGCNFTFIAKVSRGFSVVPGYQLYREDCESDFYSNWMNVAYVSLSQNLGRDFSVSFTPSLAWRRYDDQSKAFGDVREDLHKQVSVHLSKALGKHLKLFSVYEYTENDSNLGLYQYRRNKITGGLSYHF